MALSKHWSALLEDYVIDLAWSPDGSLLAAAAQSGAVILYDAATGAVKHTLAGHENGTNCLAWEGGRVIPKAPTLAASDERRIKDNPPSLLATGGQDGCVRFWDAATGLQTAEAKLGNDWVEHVVWVGRVIPNAPSLAANDERRVKDNPQCLFAAAGKKLVAIHPDGSLAHAFPDAPKSISALSLKTDGSTVAAACFGQVALWNARTFTAEHNFPYGNAIYALTWSPDRRWLVAGCHDNAVHLWAPAEEGMELHMSGYETRLKELSFSADAKWLATGGGRDCCVWDCSGRGGPEGREPLALPHANRVCALEFQHQGKQLATGATDGVFTLWDPTKNNPLLAEARLPSAATKFAWSPDDSLLACGTEKGALFVFKV